MEDIIVVKLGGGASESLDQAFFNQIRKWREENKKIVIIHGGGHAISQMMEHLGIPVQMKKGRRITSKETLDVSKMVLIGQVQPEISTKFQKENIPLIGLNASNAHLLEAVPTDDAELGFVGEISRVNTHFLQEILTLNAVLLIAPLGLDSNHNWWNVNADVAASAVASALNADTFYLLTDVPGVKKEGTLLKAITPFQIQDLIEKGDVFGGMIPKLKSAVGASQNGVKKVYISKQIGVVGTEIKREVRHSDAFISHL